MSVAPNFAPSSGYGWGTLSEPDATVDTFTQAADEIHFAASSTAAYPGAGSHCSVWFPASPTPGETLTLTIPGFELLQIPAAHAGIDRGPAIYFVLVGDPSGEYASPMISTTGTFDLSFSMKIPAGVTSARIAIGNGGPTVDGRYNAMFDGDTVEFSFDPTQVTLTQGGLLLTDTGPYFDGEDTSAGWSSVPHWSTSIEVP